MASRAQERSKSAFVARVCAWCFPTTRSNSCEASVWDTPALPARAGADTAHIYTGDGKESISGCLRAVHGRPRERLPNCGSCTLWFLVLFVTSPLPGRATPCPSGPTTTVFLPRAPCPFRAVTNSKNLQGEAACVGVPS